MIRQMAIAIAFPGFSDLGHTVTPVFLLMNHFLYRFSAFEGFKFCENVGKIWNYLCNRPTSAK